MGILVPTQKWENYKYLFSSIKYFRSFLVHFASNPTSKIIVDNLANTKSAALIQKHFVFISGNPQNSSIEDILLDLPNQCYIIVSQNEFNRNWKNVLLKRWRHVFQKSRWSFSSNQITKHFIQTKKVPVPTGYELNELTKADTYLFDEEMSKSPLIFYGNLNEFLEKSIVYGVLDLKEDTLVSLCAGYQFVNQEVEIDIRTKNDSKYRHKGLGTAVAIGLIEHVLDISKIPVWDAQNEISRKMALKLGFTDPKEYYVYDCRS